MAKVSICVPIYSMDNGTYFLERNLMSIFLQKYKNYEVIISDDSGDDFFETWLRKYSNYPIYYYKNPGSRSMADNTNNAIDQATGELVKILFQDDYFAHTDALGDIVKHFTDRTMWLATGCTHTMDGVNTFNDHRPFYSESENTIGSPSVLTFRREIKERFDPNFHWVLDLDLYKRLYRLYDKPKIYDPVNVVIGIHLGQKTNLLSDERKNLEYKMLRIKHDTYGK